MARERDKAVAGNALFFETLFAAEIEQVDNERSVSHFTTQTTDQFNGRFDSAAGCQQIVHHQNFVARFDGINVDLQLIGAVFQVVSFTDGFTRSLPGLRTGTKPTPRPRATGAPNKKPRASVPTTLVMPAFL